MKLSKDLLEKATLWAKADCFDKETKKEIQDLLDSKNESELTNRFYRDLEFGTGGMRGIMGAGTARFNAYNVKRASQALASYLRELYGDKEIKVAVTYDSRNNSRLYAELACEVLTWNKIKCILTRNMRPVPMLSFMVRHFQCDAGICITASHNPAQYNGYKIYWKSGGQLSPPHDNNIFKYYSQLNDYSKLHSLPLAEAKKKALLSETEEELDNAYIEKLSSLSLFKGNRNLKIVYSPIHGSGIFALPKALARFGFEDLSIVEEQSKPDGNFPTVSSPNPEDPKALDLALKLAKKLNADIVLGTDPDADRLAVMVREDKEWKMFTGNQMGALLFDYVLSQSKKQNKLPANGLAIKTVVTSDLLKDVAEHYGLACEETLTGFKWICDLVEDYESGKNKPYKQFVCGAEESYGFLTGTFVRDKDAVLSAVIATEMLAYYRSIHKHLSEVLDDIYIRHGVYYELLETLTLPGKEGDEKIRKIMIDLRKSPPHKIGGFKVLSLKDYQTRQWQFLDKDEFKSKGSISLPVSDVLEFNCEHAKISIRPSGTEPKIKVYISVFESTKNHKREDLASLKEKAASKAKTLLSAFSSF